MRKRTALTAAAILAVSSLALAAPIQVTFENTSDAGLFAGTGTWSRVAGHGGFMGKFQTGNGNQYRKYSPSGVDYMMGAGTISADVDVYYDDTTTHGTASYCGGLLLHTKTANSEQYYAWLKVTANTGVVQLVVGSSKSSGHTAAVTVPAGTFTPNTTAVTDVGWYHLSAVVSSDASGNYKAVVTATDPLSNTYTATYVDSGTAKYTTTAPVGFYGYCQWGGYFCVDNFQLDPLPPNGVTDLASPSADWNKINLQWTAPSDSMLGPVAWYDLRYSTNPITDDVSFNAATALTAPTPASPGTVQTLSVTGLSPLTTYNFAMKCYNAANLVSPMSNVLAATTLALDVIPPARIADLAATVIKPNYATLTWTAVGDDGMTGNAAGYDMRYGTTAITDDASFTAATAVTLPAPKTPGSPETTTVHSLAPDTTYFFAIKAKDEVPNWSALSNVVTFRTLPADLAAPNAIPDLHATGGHGAVILSWTTPADVGTAGMAGYDIRYSTALIDDSNWAGATQLTNEPVPAAPGTPQTFTVGGLASNTAYYFAIKSFDYAEPTNVSALSNVAGDTTMPPIVPVTVHNPWLVNDRVADTHNITTMGTTYVNAYTPDGVIAPTSNEQKAINIYNNQKRRLYHWTDEPPSVGGNGISDPTYTQNVFGWSLCGRHANMGCTIANAAGLTPRFCSIPGHNIFEVQYDGGWHLLDTMTTMYVFTKGTPHHIASLAEISADHTIMTNAVADGRACPGFLLCGDDPVWYAGDGNGSGADHWSTSGNGVQTTKWNGNMDLRLGQSFMRTWESWLNEHPPIGTGSPPGTTPPYHHEASHDNQDSVNYAYWEPYRLTTAQSSAINISYNPTFRRWANGTDTLAPDFTSAACQSLMEAASHDTATTYEDALAPALHVKTVGTTAEAIFKISVPFYITDAVFSGDFVKTNSGDICTVFFSSNGTSWTQVWTAPSTGTTHVANQSLRTNVFGLWQTWYIKLQFKGTVAKSDAGVSNFSVVTTFEHNKGAMAYLDKGVNNITLTFDNAAELLASGNLIHLYYKWKEYNGVDWTIDQHFEGYYAASPTAFTIVTNGTKVPRTEYILLEVVPSPIDPTPPGQINNLAAAAGAGCTVPLTWTATGDDGTVGAAMAYDLRYSTSPITDDASFNLATQVVGVPAPKASGSAESFTITYLAGDTTYYFAIKAVDKGNKRSPLSNVATARTGPAPRINDLAAGPAGSSKVSLTWTAISDGSGGNEVSYDLRYSTTTITDNASFNAATPISGLPAPKSAGGSESCLVTGLAGATDYWFAIKATDKVGQRSTLSNVVYVRTAEADLVPPDWVGDLKARPSTTGGGVDLTWTAPADWGYNHSGPFTCTSYDIRYSTSPILCDDGGATWNAATQVTGEPAPKAPGGSESLTISGLTAGTTYYFAIKAADDAPTPNVSEVSNCAASKPSNMGEKVLQRGLNSYAGVLDSYVYGGGTTTNYGTIDRMTITGWLDQGIASVQRGIVKFDLTGQVPGGVTVTSATLYLYAYDATQSKGTSGFYGAYPVTRDWTESGVTWNNATATNAWTTAGGDFLAVPDGTSPKQSSGGTPASSVWYTFNVTSRVLSWLAGSSTNYGWAIAVTDENLHVQDRFYQSDAGSAALRPKLVISDLKPRKVGDINGDDAVNVGDLLSLVGSWATNPSIRGYEPWADLNNDSYVNVGDLQVLIAHWGE